MHFMQTESVLQTKYRSGPAKNRFSVALVAIIKIILLFINADSQVLHFRYCLKECYKCFECLYRVLLKLSHTTIKNHVMRLHHTE